MIRNVLSVLVLHVCFVYCANCAFQVKYEPACVLNNMLSHSIIFVLCDLLLSFCLANIQVTSTV